MFSWGHFYLTLQSAGDPAAGRGGAQYRAVPAARRHAMGFDDPHFKRSDEQMAAESLDWSRARKWPGSPWRSCSSDGFARLKVGTPDTYAPHAQRQLPDTFRQSRAQGLHGGRRQLPSCRCSAKARTSSRTGRRRSAALPTPAAGIARTPIRRSQQKYPLNILSPKNHAFLNSGYGQHRAPAGARRRAVRGDASCTMLARAAWRKASALEVFNDRGRFHAELQVSDEVRQGVILAPLGYWASNSPNGRSVNVVNSSRYADMGRRRHSRIRWWRSGGYRCRAKARSSPIARRYLHVGGQIEPLEVRLPGPAPRSWPPCRGPRRAAAPRPAREPGATHPAPRRRRSCAVHRS